MNIKKSVDKILNQIEATKVKTGISTNVKLVAATKTQTASKIIEAHLAGVQEIGENRIQEAVEKLKALGFPKLKRRFIGHLQTNKINKCVDLFDTIDSIDSLRLAKKINKRAALIGKRVPSLLEINITQEPQKKGFTPEEVDEMLATLGMENLNVCGLMTLGPKTREEKPTRRAFRALRRLKEDLNHQHREKEITELSMGMSKDYVIGVEEGSTMVRIGTGIFGKRQ